MRPPQRQRLRFRSSGSSHPELWEPLLKNPSLFQGSWSFICIGRGQTGARGPHVAQ